MKGWIRPICVCYNKVTDQPLNKCSSEQCVLNGGERLWYYIKLHLIKNEEKEQDQE